MTPCGGSGVAPVRGGFAGESSAYEVDHRDVDYGFGAVGVGLVVAGEASVVHEPAGWVTKARHNVRDYERLPQHSECHLTWALITLMTSRLTRKFPRKDG